MTVDFQDILSAICSQVTPVSETEFQQIYMLGDSKEARLAYDILTASGFEVKFYAEADGAKLYVTRPVADNAALRAKLDTARALAVNFKAIKNSLDELNKTAATGVADYAITFVNAAANHKQITISLIPPANQPAASPAAAPRPAAAKASIKPPVKKPAKVAEEEMLAGPQISREYTFASKAKRGPNETRTFKNYMSRFLVQHVGANGTLILTMIFAALVIISLFIMSKSFLCPDFAVEKTKQNHSAFCHKGEEVDDQKLPQ